jgi:hypothetical protein
MLVGVEPETLRGEYVRSQSVARCSSLAPSLSLLADMPVPRFFLYPIPIFFGMFCLSQANLTFTQPGWKVNQLKKLELEVRHALVHAQQGEAVAKACT